MVMHNSCVELQQTMLEDSMSFSAAPYASMPSTGKGTEVILYQKTAIGIGNNANNPWLHELPDPISKVTGTTTLQ